MVVLVIFLVQEIVNNFALCSLDEELLSGIHLVTQTGIEGCNQELVVNLGVPFLVEPQVLEIGQELSCGELVALYTEFNRFLVEPSNDGYQEVDQDHEHDNGKDEPDDRHYDLTVLICELRNVVLTKNAIEK